MLRKSSNLSAASAASASDNCVVCMFVCVFVCVWVNTKQWVCWEGSMAKGQGLCTQHSLVEGKAQQQLVPTSKHTVGLSAFAS